MSGVKDKETHKGNSGPGVVQMVPIGVSEVEETIGMDPIVRVDPRLVSTMDLPKTTTVMKDKILVSTITIILKVSITVRVGQEGDLEETGQGAHPEMLTPEGNGEIPGDEINLINYQLLN